ncbi:MAG: ATP-binding protein [Deltaproteobacteria bacterium]|nr:MAG: ATP-binding protein [Deltaproteobacteria bacterium]
MFERPFWEERIRACLESRSVLWLAGVRRTGKTVLCRMLEDALYFDCELPRVRRQLEDPEIFFGRNRGRLVVLDEIHRLLNPSEVLKIAADHFPDTKVVATGSSTLSARRKFRDTLAGRKHSLWLQPAILADMESFGIEDVDRRMLAGGLPPMLLSERVADTDYLEWMDSYWAKDLQELFNIERKASFMKLVELLFLRSGNLFTAQPLAAACEISRQTVMNYLEALEVTLLVTVLRPFSGSSATEIKSQPKVYAFDTGFVCFYKGIDSLRDEDRGLLLEHLVLGEILARWPRQNVFFWRDKQKHEVDFVLKKGRGKEILAIECKHSHRSFSPSGLKAFRRRYPLGKKPACLPGCSGALARQYWRRRSGDSALQ